MTATTTDSDDSRVESAVGRVQFYWSALDRGWKAVLLGFVFLIAVALDVPVPW